MKNYTYGWSLEERGYIEVPEYLYTEYQNKRKEYIDILSIAVEKAKCGWDEVKYKVMSYQDKFNEEFMVLCIDGDEARWIPITGNSDGCNLQALGENLW